MEGFLSLSQSPMAEPQRLKAFPGSSHGQIGRISFAIAAKLEADQGLKRRIHVTHEEKVLRTPGNEDMGAVVKNRVAPKWVALVDGNKDDLTCGPYPGGD